MIHPSFITNDLGAVATLCNSYLISFIIIVSTRHSFSTILLHEIAAWFALPATVNHYANASGVTNFEFLCVPSNFDHLSNYFMCLLYTSDAADERSSVD